jgi:hypothetical protein
MVVLVLLIGIVLHRIRATIYAGGRQMLFVPRMALMVKAAPPIPMQCLFTFLNAGRMAFLLVGVLAFISLRHG